MPSQRLTPTKFATAHIKASISSGRLVKLLPHYPLDGQNATVEISSLGELLNDDAEYRELTEFPGPLVKGVTHKKVVIEFCENRIRNTVNCDIADVESYVLMWELLILLLKQNGVSKAHLIKITNTCATYSSKSLSVAIFRRLWVQT